MNAFPPISQLIPHSEPMVLLDRLVDWSPGFARCAFRVRPESRFVEKGMLATPLTIEHMAQAVAVCLGYEAYRGGRASRVGMIVSCRDFRVHEPETEVGSDLLVSVRQLRANRSTSHFDCEVHDARENRIATAVLTLYHGALPVG
jgi:predicted hotdog family 3-hydroxylacyl-ACP dehydratase